MKEWLITEAQVKEIQDAFAELSDASNEIGGRAMSTGPSAFPAIQRYNDAEFNLGELIAALDEEEAA